MLTRSEATIRSALIDVDRYRVELDLTRGEKLFRAHSRIDFTARAPGGDTFLDFRGAAVHSAILNGHPIDPGTADGTRIPLPGLATHNRVELVTDGRYSDDGQGLVRVTDPADGRTYLYSQSQVADAPRIYPCFDQPDLKAPFELRVTAPPEWEVRGVSPGTAIRDGHWRFLPTPPLPTYCVALVAGDYHVARAVHDGVPLGLACRTSLAGALETAELFALTGRLIDRFRALFGRRLPFAKYDQVFCPGFNAGAMENPGLVTLRDDYLFADGATPERRQFRALTLAHEMAHMWFGNLVTLRWWDDLWLAESFADLMAFLVVEEAGGFGSAWSRFCADRKEWGYRTDRRPAAHPILGDVPDTDAVLARLNGITYGKGAGVLRQLMAVLGREAFVGGLRQYLDAHRDGNADRADFLAALGRASGRSLDEWSGQWLATAGTNRLTTTATVEAGRYTTVRIEQSAPPEHPTLRAHRLRVGVYDLDAGRLRRRAGIQTTVSGAGTTLPSLIGTPEAALLLVNEADEAWAEVILDDRSTQAVCAALPSLADPVARAVCWQALWTMVDAGRLSVDRYLGTVHRALADEGDGALTALVLRRAQHCLDLFSRPERRAERARVHAAHCRTLLSETRDDRYPLYLAAFVDAAVDPGDLGTLRAWLAAGHGPGGAPLDAEQRWRMIHRLAVAGQLDATEVGEYARSAGGPAAPRRTARALAALPDLARKRAVLERLSDPRTPRPTLRAEAEGLFAPDQAELTRPLIDAVLGLIPRLWQLHGEWTAAQLAYFLYPRYHIDTATLDRVDRIAAADIDARAREALLDNRFDAGRALAVRNTDAG